MNLTFFDTIDELFACKSSYKYLRVIQDKGKYAGEGYADAKTANNAVFHLGGMLFLNKQGDWRRV